MSSSTTLNPSILLQDFQPRGWNRAGVEGEVTHGLGLGLLGSILRLFFFFLLTVKEQ